MLSRAPLEGPKEDWEHLKGIFSVESSPLYGFLLTNNPVDQLGGPLPQLRVGYRFNRRKTVSFVRSVARACNISLAAMLHHVLYMGTPSFRE